VPYLHYYDPIMANDVPDFHFINVIMAGFFIWHKFYISYCIKIK